MDAGKPATRPESSVCQSRGRPSRAIHRASGGILASRPLSHHGHPVRGLRHSEATVQFNPHVLDIWVFRRGHAGVEFLLLHASQIKADRHFNGGRFWQIPSGVFGTDESALQGIDRVLAPYEITAEGVWAAEHTYTIYNRRFEEIQIVSVFAAEVAGAVEIVRLDPAEHAECAWLPYEVALDRVHYRGLKEGLRSTREYVTGAASPALELRLR